MSLPPPPAYFAAQAATATTPTTATNTFTPTGQPFTGGMPPPSSYPSPMGGGGGGMNGPTTGGGGGGGYPPPSAAAPYGVGPPMGYGGPPVRPPYGGPGFGGPPSGSFGSGPAPTYIPPIPYPSEEEIANRPVPTANCDPFDETYPTYNIFVGDMTPDFTEADLYAAYQQAGPIHSVSVVKDKFSGLAKGFGFVNFLTQQAKDYALEHMKTAYSRGIPVRCFVSDSKSAVLITNVPNWEPKLVKAELERIGGPMVGEPQLQKPGLWLANYINYRRAEKALSLLNGRPCGPSGPPMSASLAVGKQSGTASMPPKPHGVGLGSVPGKPPPATLFIKNIASSIDEPALAKYFGKHGQVTKATIVRDHTTNESKGFGFVEFSDQEEATKAFNGTNMTMLDAKMLSVEFAKIPQGQGPAAQAGGLGAAISSVLPVKAPMVPRREPKSRHQNDGDGGFNAPRGFSDAAMEVRTGLTFYDDNWTTEHVPQAAAIAGTNGPPPAGPIMKDGHMVGWGRPTDEKLLGLQAPPQGTPESRCRAQRQLGAQYGHAATLAQAPYDQLMFQSYAGPVLPTAAATAAFGSSGGGGGGFGGGPSFGGGRGGGDRRY